MLFTSLIAIFTTTPIYLCLFITITYLYFHHHHLDQQCRKVE